MMEIDLALIEQLREFETPLVAEGLGALGCSELHRYYMGAEIRMLTDTPQPAVGVAVTLEVDTSSPQLKPDTTALYDALDEIVPMKVPAMLMLKTVGSRPQHECVLGDGVAKISQAAGCCGAVTDGGVRDLAGIARLGFGVFARGPVVNHATFVLRKPRGPIEIGGIEVADGDLVHADSNGVHLVPPAYHLMLVEACILSRDFETRAHTFMRRSDVSTEDKLRYVDELRASHHTRCHTLAQQAS